jgi:tRNA1(Val) A37 N6-methylase TrmN6
MYFADDKAKSSNNAHLRIPRSRVAEKLTVASWSTNSSHVMEPQGTLACTQQPVIGILGHMNIQVHDRDSVSVLN